MLLIEKYKSAVDQGDIVDDKSQREVVEKLQSITDMLNNAYHSWFKKIPLMSGLYLYGPVGVGKTYLMDLFFNEVNDVPKLRFHFHHFMQQIDTHLRRMQGQHDPLPKIVKTLLKNIKLLCLDEFFVDDIADAMILSEFLRALFAQKIVLVVTSNVAPDDLYLNGLQRMRFLPAIELLKKHCHICELNKQIDYRLGRAPLSITWFYPLDVATQQSLREAFLARDSKSLINSTVSEQGLLQIQNRSIAYIMSCHRRIWFEFAVICNVPRCQLDYLEIAEKFDTIFISDIPKLDTCSSAQIILFIHLIDVLYDRGICLLASAEVALNDLYSSGPMYAVFQRTQSRLTEMQSFDYLHRHHRRVLDHFSN